MTTLITPNQVKGLNIDNNVILLSGNYIPTDTEILNRNIKVDFSATPNILFFHTDGTLYLRTDEDVAGTFTWKVGSLSRSGLKLRSLEDVSPIFYNLQIPVYSRLTDSFIPTSVEGLKFSNGPKVTDVKITYPGNNFGYTFTSQTLVIEIYFDQDITIVGYPKITVNYLGQDFFINLYRGAPGNNLLFGDINIGSTTDISYEPLKIVSKEIELKNSFITNLAFDYPANLQLNYSQKIPNITINTFDFDLIKGPYGGATEKLLDINPDNESTINFDENFFISTISSSLQPSIIATAPSQANKPKLIRNYHAGYNAILFSGNQYLDFLTNPANLNLTGSIDNNTLNKWTMVFVWQEIEGQDSYIFSKSTQYDIGFDNEYFEPFVGNVEINGNDSAFLYRMSVFGIVTNGASNSFHSYLGTRFANGIASQESTANPGDNTSTRVPRLGASMASNGNPRWHATGYLLRLIVYRGDLSNTDMVNLMEEMKKIYKLN